jgi:PqqD family protein of HPr-rel-A system
MTGKKLAHLALSDNGFLFDSATGHTYSLNQTGTSILRLLIKGVSVEEIMTSIMEEYEISAENISKDLNQFLHFISELGLIERGCV